MVFAYFCNKTAMFEGVNCRLYARSIYQIQFNMPSPKNLDLHQMKGAFPTICSFFEHIHNVRFVTIQQEIAKINL